MGSIFVMFYDYFLKKLTDAFESLSVNLFPSYSYSLQFLHSQLNILLLRDFLQLGQNWFRK